MSPWWSRQVPPVQGTLEEAPPAELLRKLAAERRTGTLTVTRNGVTCSLYFLFGHLYHALSPDGTGEAVLGTLLGWTQGTYTFDTQRKLPTEETITRSTANLLDDLAGGDGQSVT